MNPIRFAALSLVTLTVWIVLWEWLLAPIHAGGSIFILKAVPISFLAWGGLKGQKRAFQIASLLLPWYFAEECWRVVDGHQQATVAAAIAIVITVSAWWAAVKAAQRLKGGVQATADDGQV